MYDQRTEQVTNGDLDYNTGVFTTDDGKRWVSVGSLDYGNNNCLEVMVLETKPNLDESFHSNQYPVFIFCHEEDEHNLGMSVVDFLKEESRLSAHHIPTILLQLGEALKRY